MALPRWQHHKHYLGIIIIYYMYNFSLSPTKFLQPPNLGIFTTLSFFNLCAVPAEEQVVTLLSLFLAHQPSFSWKSVHSFRYASPPLRINFQIHSVSLTSLVSVHLLIHLSTHLSHHPRCLHPSLLHSFTPGSKPTFSTNPCYLRFFFAYWTASW